MRDETKMDANSLITEIYKRPALWNQRHIYYHNRDITNRFWMEIAALFKLPKQVLKTKWKGLRDTFRAEIKKEQVYRKSNYTPNRPVWIHFKTLQFLKEQMLPRPPIWERSNNSPDNDETSGGASEDSCSRIAGESEDLSDLALVLANTNDRREAATLDTTAKDKRRVGKRTRSNFQQQISSANHNGDVLRAAAGGCTDADSTKDEPSPAINSRIHRRSDCGDNNNNNNNNNNNHHHHHHRHHKNGGGNSNRNEKTNSVKEEPVDHYEDNVEEFGNVVEEMKNLDGSNADSMLENMSTEEVLMAETAEENCVIASQLLVDPLEGNRFDDNYYFLMSLLPHIRSLPAERRMLLRMQMQQLVYQEVYNRSSSVSSLRTFVSSHPAEEQSP